MLCFYKLIAGFLREARGFTLLEMSVALPILVLAVGLVGAQVFQVLAIQQTWQGDALATKDLRHAESWFAGDALNAQVTSLGDGGGQVDSVMLTTWSDQITYGISGSDFIRSVFDGTETQVNILATDAIFAGFSRNGKVLNFRLEVASDNDTTNSINLQSYLR